MSLSAISIRRPVFAWMLMVGLVIFGALCFKRLGVSQMPDVDFPVVNVSLSLAGAAPEVMETQVVDPVEDAVMGIEGIRSVTSNSRQSSANVTVEFELNRNIDVALQEVQTRIAQVRRMLPQALDPPVIRKTNPEDQPIIWLIMASDGRMSRFQQMIYARTVLYDQFSTIAGVGDINLGGYVAPNLRVWINGPKLNAYELTADDIVKAIQNEHLETPAGRIENDRNEFNLRLMGQATNPTDFGKINLGLRGSQPNFAKLRLNQVAKVEEGLADVRRLSRFNGQEAIGLGILKQHGSNAVEVAQAIRKRIDEIRPGLPAGLTLDVRMDNTKYIKESIFELNTTLVLSALLTSLVCFLFLGSWSSTFNILLAIPTSIVGAFIGIYAFKFTLNTFTLLGLSLAIGIVVDDAIMMLENIYRYVELGFKRREAALKGSEEITFAAVVATIAVVAIFMPVVFMKGIIGRYFFQYGVTVTVAVLLSLLEALTLTPMRCARFLKPSSHSGWISRVMDRFMGWLAHLYRAALVRVLKFPLLVTLVAIGIFVGSLFISKLLPAEMMPSQDQSRLLLRLKAPVGSSIQFTNDKLQKAEALLAKMPEVTGIYSAVGGFGGDAVNEGMIFLDFKPANQRKLTQRELMDKIRGDLRKQVKGIKASAQDMSLRGFTSGRGYPVEFTVQGPDWQKLADYTQEMMDGLNKTGLVTDTNTDYQIGMPEIQLVPDRTKAASHGVDLAMVAQAVNTLVGGVVLNSSSQYPKNGHRYDIRIRLEGDERERAEAIKTLRVRNNRDELVSLSELVTIQERPSLQIISRRNRERAIAVYANIVVGHSQQDALKAVEQVGLKILPKGYHIVLTGSAQTFRESFQSLGFALLLGILFSYMVLASQFNSFIHPISVLMALPFSISGAFIALHFGHQSINIFSVIGIILLMGIVKKNSILLVDFTNQRRTHGEDVRTALLSACPVRLRPILMTSVATIAGAIPAALAFGPGAETRVPMALSIIGGVLLSTVLTLFVVPCVYELLSRVEGVQ